jgi:aspartate 4-decarboxylase
VQLALFALFFLSDSGEESIDTIAALLASRLGEMYRALGQPAPPVAPVAPYYSVLDLLELARRRHGDAFASWLRRVGRPEDLVASLGSESVVVLPGGPSGTSGWVIRISMAECSAAECAELGTRLIGLIDQIQAARRSNARSRRARRPNPA